VDDGANVEALLQRLLEAAARRAEALLTRAGDAALRVAGMDGLSEIERLELSPMAEDQFVAVAFRSSANVRGAATLTNALVALFREPVFSMAIEAQRKAVWSDNNRVRLPMEAAEEAVDALVRQVDATTDLSSVIESYAGLYTDLWCDPRIGAAPSTRRVMLAMVTVLHARRTQVPSNGSGGSGKSSR